MATFDQNAFWYKKLGVSTPLEVDHELDRIAHEENARYIELIHDMMEALRAFHREERHARASEVG